MTVRDIIELIRIRLNNIILTRDNAALIRLIYLAESELYRRFNLSIRMENIITNSNNSMYTLKNDDVNLLLSLYDDTGRELIQSDVVNGRVWEYKLVNYRSFILNKPTDGIIYCLYNASPVMLGDVDDIVDLPDAMIDALICYIAYCMSTSIRSASTLGGRGTPEGDTWYKIFEQACQSLEMQGYKIPLNSESLSILIKGYI